MGGFNVGFQCEGVDGGVQCGGVDGGGSMLGFNVEVLMWGCWCGGCMVSAIPTLINQQPHCPPPFPPLTFPPLTHDACNGTRTHTHKHTHNLPRVVLISIYLPFGVNQTYWITVVDPCHQNILRVYPSTRLRSSYNILVHCCWPLPSTYLTSSTKHQTQVII